jgi:hypothetical protein
MNRSYNLGINPENPFYPMCIIFFLDRVRSHPTPRGIFNAWIGKLKIEVRIGIPDSYKQLIDIVLVLHNIEVAAYTPVWSTSLGSDLCNNIFLMFCITHTKLKDREVLSLEVQSKECLVLPIVTHLSLYRPEQVCTNYYPLKQGGGIFRSLNSLLSRESSVRKQQTNQKDAGKD